MAWSSPNRVRVRPLPSRAVSNAHEQLGAPQPPPEVEQAALLGHIDDAVNLYVKFTDVDPEVARQVVEKLAEG
jgi:hypothetical protein